MCKRQLKVLHAAVSMNPSVGVLRQMEWEQRAADDLGLPWQVKLWTPKSLMSKVVVAPSMKGGGRLHQYVTLRTAFSRWLKQENEGVDLILLRHSVHDLFQLDVLRTIGEKTLTVHHTLEELELAGETGPEAMFKISLERFLGQAGLRRVRGLVGVTQEIVDYERGRVVGDRGSVPAWVYPNGIFPSRQAAEDHRSDIPELLFVASFFAPWHGLDLLLSGLEQDSAPCALHLVGAVPEALRSRCLADPRIRLHGFLDDVEIASLAASAWCGLSSFALERKGMFEACTLKVREYLDAGLPVYAQHRDTGLPPEFPFFQRGPANLAQILAFAKDCRKISRMDVQKAASPYIDKRMLLAKLYEGLCAEFAMTVRKQ